TVPTDGEAPPLVDYLARKYGDRDRVRAAHQRLTAAGEELGLELNCAGMRRANTFDCHRLLTWALETGGAEPQRALKKAMLRAYFTDGEVMTDPEVLVRLVAEAEIGRASCRERV